MRRLYGGTAADVTTSRSGRILPGEVGTAWYTRAGGARATDLTDLDSTPTDTVTSDADALVLFNGPPDYDGPLWLDFGLGYRTLVQPVDRAPLTAQGTPTITWKGGNVSAWNAGEWADISKVTDDVERLALNVVTVPVRVAADDIYDSAPAVDQAHKAHALAIIDGLHPDVAIIAEPYPWVNDGTESETLWVPTSVPDWFEAWTAACVEVTEAIPQAVMHYTGSNMVSLEGEDTASWAGVAAAVRAAGATQVAYRCNWWYEPVRLQALKDWGYLDVVDVIAIAAYFELTETLGPHYDEVRACLDGSLIYARDQNIVADVAALSAAHGNKPMYFGELNCGNGTTSLSAPWNPDVSTDRDKMTQYRLFRAYAEAFGPQPWWQGFSVFNIGHPWDDSRYLLDAPAARYIAALPAGVTS